LCTEGRSLKLIDKSFPLIKKNVGRFSCKATTGAETEFNKEIKRQICNKIANCLDDSSLNIKSILA
jgi:hypothetical protein